MQHQAIFLSKFRAFEQVYGEATRISSHHIKKGAKTHQWHNWSWCANAKEEDQLQQCWSAWLYRSWLQWIPRWNEKYCMLHIHDWRSTNLLELEEVRDIGLIILWSWVCSNILCSFSSFMNRNVAWRTESGRFKEDEVFCR